MANHNLTPDDWAEAQRRCHLNEDDMRMATELGFTPRTLIKNIPSPRQRWKLPVKEWIRRLYNKRHGAPDVEIAEGLPERYRAQEPSDLPVEDLVWLGEAGDWDSPESPLGSHEVFRQFERKRPTRQEIAEQDMGMQRRQGNFRMAAQYVAREFALLPEVVKVALFGSVVEQLKKEIPRFSNFRRKRVRVWHECNDVDLAVWLTGLGHLKNLQRARGRALNQLMAEHDIGVPHFQVDVHILEPGTDRYRGRLCNYGECPKPGKNDCLVDGCGAQPFLQQFDGYKFSRFEFWDTKKEILFARESAASGQAKQEAGTARDITPDTTDDDVPF